MSRARERVTLENGLKLDLNRLARKGFVQPGAYRGSGISWTNQQGIRGISLAIDDDRRTFSLPQRNFSRINQRFEKPSKIVALEY